MPLGGTQATPDPSEFLPRGRGGFTFGRRPKRHRRAAPAQITRQSTPVPDRSIPAIPLDRYLIRLDRLLAEVEAGGRNARLIRELDELRADLESVHAPPAITEQLGRLVEELRSGRPSERTVERLRHARSTSGGGRRGSGSADSSRPRGGGDESTRRRVNRPFWR